MKTITGKFTFQTIKTAKGRDRYLAKVTGTLDGNVVSAQYFGDWDGKFPKNLELVNANGYRSPETGLIRSVSGALEGTVTFDESLPVVEKAGDVAGVILRQIDLPDPDGFVIKATNRQYSACTL